MANTYDVGDLVRVSAVFADGSGAAVDPSSVLLSYRAPSGTVTNLTYGTDAALMRDSAGHFHADINADESGIWLYRWHSTGTGQAAEENRFTVRERLVV